jgi:hypothetical protein
MRWLVSRRLEIVREASYLASNTLGRDDMIGYVEAAISGPAAWSEASVGLPEDVSAAILEVAAECEITGLTPAVVIDCARRGVDA